MKYFRWRETRWGAYTFALCCAVLLYSLIQHFDVVVRGITVFAGFCKPVLYGATIAYMIDPLVRFLQRSVFSGIRKPSLQRTASVATATLLVILIFIWLLLMLIPQLLQSITGFASEISTYSTSLRDLVMQLNELSSKYSFIPDLSSLTDLLDNFVSRMMSYLSGNMTSILSTITGISTGVVSAVISFILAIYCLSDKKNLLTGIGRLNQALMPPKTFEYALTLYREINTILSQYIYCELIDAVIIGVTNAVFMSLMNMPYATLVSVIVAITNLAPTFGPIIGAGIGGFILLLSSPLYALFFLIFTVFLQILDGYIIKPKLFGSALRVPSVWILISIIVGGRMFGVAGILLAIPFAAIGAYLLRELLRDLETERKNKKQEAAN